MATTWRPIDAAIQAGQAGPAPVADRRAARTSAIGMPTRQDTAKAHGEPPGDEELNGAKQKLGWPLEPRFLRSGGCAGLLPPGGDARRAGWKGVAARAGRPTRAAYPELAAELERRLAGELPAGWDADLPEFPADPKGMATRVASGKVLNALAPALPELMGGSADLAPSNKTWIDGLPAHSSPATPTGATSTSACASTPWARSSTAWRSTAA